MFRMWGKVLSDNHIIKDTTICLADYNMSRTEMVLEALGQICYEFDLSKPIWLSANIRDFQHTARTRFTQDCFIEQIPFDSLEIQIIEE